MKRIIVFATAIALIGAVRADATKFAGEFMALGGGARAMGMGGAFAAVAADASTVFWNPAGIAGREKRQLLAMHSERFGDLVNYNFASYVQPADFLLKDRGAAIGFALIHLGVDDIPITSHLGFADINGNGEYDPESGEFLTDADGNPADLNNIPFESDNSFALLSSVALATAYGEVGGTLKLIYSDNVAGHSSTGIGIDLGYLHRDLVFENFDVGVKLQDATGTYISWDTGTNEFILPMVKVGGAYELVSEEFRGSLLLAYDADVYFDSRKSASQLWAGSVGTDHHLGAELSFERKVMVRGGLDAGNPTAGAGLRIGMLGFDYAYLHHSEEDGLEDTHRVSALVDF